MVAPCGSGAGCIATGHRMPGDRQIAYARGTAAPLQKCGARQQTAGGLI